jgi:hypothetical protein
MSDEIEIPVDSPEPPPPSKSERAGSEFWSPDLNPTQKLIFDDPSKSVLGYGEKGSGKSIGFGHKIVRHAYENANALVLVISPSMRTGNEGIWFDLETLILPQWKEGIGLDYSNSMLDPNTKDRHRWVANRFGGWSKLLLMSIPYAQAVQNRVKGPAPSMVYVDELTNCNGKEYYTYPLLQLGRRRGPTWPTPEQLAADPKLKASPQQFCASCNPEGPTHWVYETFFVECVNQETGERDPDFAVYHVPISENNHRLPAGYVEGITKALRGDETERRRLIHGEWVDKQAGDGLFVDHYRPNIHVIGDAIAGTGLQPNPNYQVIISYDIGPMWPSITFEQLVPTDKKNLWLVFDEIDRFGVKTLYRVLAREVIERIKYWNKLAGKPLSYLHVTDESAVNQWRAGGDGSYDAWEFEKEYNAAALEMGDTSMRDIKMQGCPKGPGSVEARVRMLQAKLAMDEIFVSAGCFATKDMLANLLPDKEEPSKPRRSKWIHKFDSLTYGMFKSEMLGNRINNLQARRVAPTLIRCGSA